MSEMAPNCLPPVSPKSQHEGRPVRHAPCVCFRVRVSAVMCSVQPGGTNLRLTFDAFQPAAARLKF